MIWEMLLSATIETGVGLLAEIGLGDLAQKLQKQLHRSDAKERAAALQAALNRATAAAADPEIQPLLEHRPFREEVVRALLDPLHPFDVQTQAAYWGEQFSQHALKLQRFFLALQNALLEDAVWGPVLERYQSLAFQREVKTALANGALPSNAALTRAVGDAFQATLRGNGAVAQGKGAKAVGAGGILVEGDYAPVVRITINRFLGERDAPAKDARQRYLQETASEANLLPWSVVSSDQSNPARGADLRLADIYIDLDTTKLRHMTREEELRDFLRRQDKAERIPAQDMVNEADRLLLMGDPGSGKSTFVKHLTYLLAKASLANDETFLQERLEKWNHGALLPIRIELRRMAAFAREKKPNDDARRLLTAYLRAELEEMGLKTFWDELHPLLTGEETSALFLLDGLDEVPTDQRQMVVDAVNALSQRYPAQRFVVTCRPYAYVGQPWQLENFTEATLAPFDKAQIDAFIENWYRQLSERKRISREEAARKAESLQRAVRRRDLLGLAERPLLLTVMAQLHAYKGKLPEDRTQLYADAVELLLERWETRLDTIGVLEYLDIPGLKMSDLKSGLYRVAFEAHRAADLSESDRTADIAEEQLRGWLAPYLADDWNKAGQFIEYIRERAGLLIRHKTDAYTFPHRSFQEYLAACHWLSLSDYPEEARKMMREDWDRWREVFVLSAGYAARTERLGQALAAVNALLPREYRAGQRLDENQARLALLAAQSLVEIGLVGVRREETGQVVLERIQGWLLAALASKTLPPRVRAEAGRALAKPGDPRFRPLPLPSSRRGEGVGGGKVLLPADPTLGFLRVPAGAFIMGTRSEDIPALVKKYGGGSEWYERETSRHEVTLSYDYWLAKYPVTNAQFQAFVDAGGYERADLWTEAREAGVWEKGKVKEWSGDEPRAMPYDYGEPFNLPNHPAVGVTWYEALAYVRWLDERLKAASRQRAAERQTDAERSFWEALASGKYRVTLPSEAEWEKAARGADGRVYPWDDVFSPDHANTRETGLGTTSAVGAFPKGASSYGALDMSGNVWEWTRSLYKEYPYPSDPQERAVREDLKAPRSASRVLRGGSFYHNQYLARCAARYWYFPYNRLGHYGFRVVLVPMRSAH